MIKPIQPDDIRPTQIDYNPRDPVHIAVFNHLIEKHWSGIEAKFGQWEAVFLICELCSIDYQEVHKRRLLEIAESQYRDAGWLVFRETGCRNCGSTFTFMKPFASSGEPCYNEKTES